MIKATLNWSEGKNRTAQNCFCIERVNSVLHLSEEMDFFPFKGLETADSASAKKKNNPFLHLVKKRLPPTVTAARFQLVSSVWTVSECVSRLVLARLLLVRVEGV